MADPQLDTITRAAGAAPGRLRLVGRRFLANRGALVGSVMVAALFILAFAGPLVSRWSYATIDYTALRQPPSTAHWWGTNGIGQDLFAQTVRGLQKSLLIGVSVALVATALAAAVGTTAGYLGGWTERVLIFGTDLLLVFPSFLIISIISPRLRSAGWVAFVGLLALFGWMISARVLRTMTISLKNREFVRAARFMGVRPARLIVRHVIPNTASFLIIDSTIAVAVAVMTETALSYFGFGVQPPDVSLGTLIAVGTDSAVTYPWIFFFPAGLLVLFVLAINLIGDGLRDAIDPTSRPARPARGSATRVGTAPEPVEPDVVLAVRDLWVRFGTAPAVRGVDLTVRRGEVLGLVGESGSGKSVTALAIAGLLPAGAAVTGRITVTGTEVVGARYRDLARIRGRRVAMVFQDSLSAFTPVYRIGDQIAEAVRAHRKVSRADARQRAVQLLELVGIPDARTRADAFPQEFSGGMRQRAMIAMAIANDPDLILADEPTTALDVTVQAQILDVLRTARRVTGAALLLVSHDLGVVAGMADEVAVMYAGRIVERAGVDDLFAHPRMPYTLGLINALPRLDTRNRPLVPIPGRPPTARDHDGCPFAPRCPLAEDACRDAEPILLPIAARHEVACRRTDHVRPTAPAHTPEQAPPTRDQGPTVLRVRELVKTFPLYRGSVFPVRVGGIHAVQGVDLDIHRGETLALVGESGSGKSSTLFELMNLTAPEGGTIDLLGHRIDRTLPAATRHRLRSEVQLVFQDPMASLDPRLPVGEIIAEPLRVQHAPPDRIRHRVAEVLHLVGLEPQHAERYPHEFSGGQRQRIAIARALSVSPRLLLLDEPVSGLDVSVQAGVLNLLRDLKARLGLAYLFVSHDLAVGGYLADRVSVMYLGRTVETGPVDSVFDAPHHPYTRALLSAVPLPDPARERARDRILLTGDPPSPTSDDTGCRFRGRCSTYAALPDGDRTLCIARVPLLSGTGHTVACHFPDRTPARQPSTSL